MAFELVSMALQNPVVAVVAVVSGGVVGVICCCGACCERDGGVGGYHSGAKRGVDCSAAGVGTNAAGPDIDIAAVDRLHDGAVGRRGDGLLLLVPAEASCAVEQMEPERE